MPSLLGLRGASLARSRETKTSKAVVGKNERAAAERTNERSRPDRPTDRPRSSAPFLARPVARRPAGRQRDPSLPSSSFERPWRMGLLA